MDKERETLSAWVRKASGEQRRARRARIVLALAEGHAVRQVARDVGVDENTVRLCGDRFTQGGIKALEADAPRPGRPRTIPAERVQAVLTLTRTTTPDGASQWSVRTMAEVARVSPASVQRIWSDAGLITSTSGNVITTYAYDGCGNMWTEQTGSATTTYSYDGDNRLILISYATGGPTTMSYQGYGDLRRTLQSFTYSVTTFVWDGHDYLQERN